MRRVTGEPDPTGGAAASHVMPRIVVMGPSGSGKSAVGVALARELSVDFVDADDLHPASNVAKMASGIPLDDKDRWPWLDVVGRALHDLPRGGVVACSALARRYRDRLRRGAPDAVFVELTVDRDELDRRMRTRDHFMPPTLLDSQMAVLEPLERDEVGIVVPNVGTLAEVTAQVRHDLAELARAQV